MDYPITPNENPDQDEIVLDEQDTQDPVELKRKMLETAEKLVDPMTESLNNTQKNVLDISDLTKQVRELSGQELHGKMVLAIMADEDTDMKTKVDLIDHVNDGVGSVGEFVNIIRPMAGISAFRSHGCPVSELVSGTVGGESVKADSKKHPRVVLTQVAKHKVLNLRVAGCQANLHRLL